MACFLVPAAEAAVTTIATKVVELRHPEQESATLPFSHKMKWLSRMLWGGSGLLAFEHVWHGEIMAAYPFLTAASNPADMAEMLHEMSTSGVAMAAVVTAVWGCMLGVSSVIEKRALSAQNPTK